MLANTEKLHFMHFGIYIYIYIYRYVQYLTKIKIMNGYLDSFAFSVET